MARKWAMEVGMAGPMTPSYDSNLRFEKTGAEIQRSIDGQISTLNGLVAESEKIITDICKRREIDAADLLKDDDRESLNQKVEAYGSTLSQHMQAKSALELLNADMQELRAQTWGIQHTRAEVEALARIKKNLQAERKFDLTYSELKRLGF